MASNVYKNFAIETNGAVYRARLWWEKRWIYKTFNNELKLTRFKFRAYKTHDLHHLFHLITIWNASEETKNPNWYETYYEEVDGKIIDVGSASPSPEPEEEETKEEELDLAEPTAGTAEIPKDEKDIPDRR